GDHAKSRTEAERVLQSARDNGVGDADVNDIRQLIACRRLAGRKTNRTGIAADNGRDAGRIHFLNLRIAAFRRRLRIAEHRIDLGAAPALEAAGGVGFTPRDRAAEPTLLTGIGQRARYRLQKSDFYGAALGAQNRRRSERTARRGDGRERGRLQKFSATESIVSGRLRLSRWLAKRKRQRRPALFSGAAGTDQIEFKAVTIRPVQRMQML